MSPNDGILFKSVLRLKLHNNPFASYSFTNLDFSLLHIAHSDNNIVLPFFVCITFESTFSVSFLHLK